jgi:membrane protease subunit HflC
MVTRIMTLLLGLVLLVGLSMVFIVDEREVAIKFRLGEIVRSEYMPGLHFKAPWPINNVRKFDRRILTLDTAPERFLTGEKKNVTVDFFVKWRKERPAARVRQSHHQAGRLG